jgi:ATP:cob(I)alamin adenosyltransferase
MTNDDDVDIEDLHRLALQGGQTSYEDPATGFTVFTEVLHLKRTTCCGNQCRHCPYGFEHVSAQKKRFLKDVPVARCKSGDKEMAQRLLREIQEGRVDQFLARSLPTNGSTATDPMEASATSPILTTAASAKNGKNARQFSTSTTSKNVPYTRKGDTGTSQLGTGERRSKADCNFEALGTVDELCSVVGVAHSHLLSGSSSSSPNPIDYGALPERLLDVMSRLFDIGSHVAKPRVLQAAYCNYDVEGTDNRDSNAGTKTTTFEPNGLGDGFDVSHIDDLEAWVDEMTEKLPELTSFILPTGALGAAQLHVARTVCRRAERRVVPLVVEDHTCDPNALKYLNRLSDFFFVAARWVNYCEGQDEIEYRRENTTTKQRERVHRSLKE